MADNEKEVSVEKYPNIHLKAEFEATLERNIDVVKKFLKDMSKAPAPKQLAVGAAAGWFVGYLTMKVGKAAATAVGGSLLVLQIAHHKGRALLFNWILLLGKN